MNKSLLIAVNVIFAIVCVAAYVLNIGWYRFVFALILVPLLLLHFILHIFLAIKPTTTQRVLYSCGSHVAAAIALISWPDVSDTPPYYAVFGLYKSPPDFFWPLTYLSFAASIILSALAVFGSGTRPSQ